MTEDRRKALTRFAVLWLAIQVLYPVAFTVYSLLSDQHLRLGWRMFAHGGP